MFVGQGGQVVQEFRAGFLGEAALRGNFGNELRFGESS
jgi:hypothetical protein